MAMIAKTILAAIGRFPGSGATAPGHVLASIALAF
jgi:hypothetical protein